ncbi:MAG: (Fe-S)-binding protein [Desulfobacterium sp.]|nr:(Fe-S)-binding protein [Desulfobacterium sp.]
MEEQHIEEMKKKVIEAVSKCRICMSCYADCPLYESTRGFVTQGPSGITRALYYGIRWDALDGKDGQDLRDILYACTTCGSCEVRCKKSACNIPLVEIIETGRKLLVEKMVGPMPKQIKVLESLDRNGNPYGEPAEERTQWLGSIDPQDTAKIKLVQGDLKTETLLFVGCTSSYERDLVNVPGSIVKIFNHMGVDYGILKDEKCCGDPALRLGEAGLFEEMAEKNTKVFEQAEIKRIVTISPHCMSSFSQDYPDLPNNITIQHYTEFFAEQMSAGNLKPQKSLKKKVTYHDPCYLGKHNDIYETPRQILTWIAGDSFVEMEHNREQALCCGGGGGRMFVEIEEIERLSEKRVQQALDVGAEIIATACPWCYSQIADGIKTSGNEGKILVKDIAELIAESL